MPALRLFKKPRYRADKLLSGGSTGVMSATQGPTRNDLSVARHPKHKQPISRKPARHYDEEEAHDSESNPSGGETETAPASDPPLHLYTHLAELEVFVEVGQVGLIQLVTAVTDNGGPYPRQQHPAKGLGEQQRRPILNRPSPRGFEHQPPCGERETHANQGPKPVPDALGDTPRVVAFPVGVRHGLN